MTTATHFALAALVYLAMRLGHCPHDIALSTAVLVSPAIRPKPVQQRVGVIAETVKAKRPRKGA